MFGLYQRDEHTIPSEFARLAEADGIPLRVVNYGSLAYVNWQEVLLLEQLVTGGSEPDLAVFYDGFNELVQPVRARAARRAHPRGGATRSTAPASASAASERGEESLPDAALPRLGRRERVHRLGRRSGIVRRAARTHGRRRSLGRSGPATRPTGPSSAGG